MDRWTDCLVPVEREVDKVLNKFASLNEHTRSTLGELITQIQQLHSDIVLLRPQTQGELSNIQVVILRQTIKKLKEVVTRIGTEHRELHATVSKVGKAVDKNFISDFNSAFNENIFDRPENVQLLNQVIVEHFLRQGMANIADELIKESQLQIPQDKKQPFTEINEILDALKRKDLGPALQWAAKNREALEAQNSCLEFKLHRLQFIELLSQGVEKQQEIINYARENFQRLAPRHEREIQTLMGSLLYLKVGLLTSPYNYLLDAVNWSEICDIFTRDACALLGLSVESPLATAVNAGCTALPALLNMKQMMAQRQVNSIWQNRDELPIEIDLGRKCQFHSIFACPILRQQSSDSNPPMRLVCGHVISKDALNKLSNGSKLKCPYCPVEQNPNDARQIYF